MFLVASVSIDNGDALVVYIVIAYIARVDNLVVLVYVDMLLHLVRGASYAIEADFIGNEAGIYFRSPCRWSQSLLKAQRRCLETLVTSKEDAYRAVYAHDQAIRTAVSGNQ